MTMKKIFMFCLMLAIGLTSQAQDDKPTKEQTIQFIKDHYKDFETSNFCKLGGGYSMTKSRTVPKIEFDQNNIMTITEILKEVIMSPINPERIKQTNYITKIDFSKIESIFMVALMGCGEG